MTDSTLVIVVTATSGIITSLAGVVTLIVKARIDRAERTLTIQASNIQKIEKQGNSLQTELVKITDQAAQARGEKKGREDEKAEVAAKALVIKDIEGAVLTVQQMEAVDAAKELLRKAAVVADVVLQNAAKKATEKLQVET